MVCYYISTPKFTVLVEATSARRQDHQLIQTAPPILRRFRGQPVAALLSWLRQRFSTRELYIHRYRLRGIRRGARH